MTSQVASETPTGTGDDTVTRLMTRYNIPMTRENYLHMAYGSDLPEPWGAELEANLPQQLQDWSQFK
jgi:hypothetical protein